MFGDEIWVVISVAQGGALGVTQALFATSFQPAAHYVCFAMLVLILRHAPILPCPAISLSQQPGDPNHFDDDTVTEAGRSGMEELEDLPHSL